jgi:hypothetical protein
VKDRAQNSATPAGEAETTIVFENDMDV